MEDSVDTFAYPVNAENITIYLMSFMEFLKALGYMTLLSVKDGWSRQILLKDVYDYMNVGGMQRCVSLLDSKKTRKEIRNEQINILQLCELDFSKQPL